MHPTAPLTVFVLALSSQAFAQRWFSSPMLLAPETNAVAVGDVDRDGDDDIITIVGTDVVALLNDGRATFVDGPTTALPSSATPEAERTKLADVDGDGVADLVIPTSSGFSVLRGTGSGSFAPGIAVSVPGQRTPLIATGDFNQDGVADIVTAGRNAPIDVRWSWWDGQQFRTTSSTLLPTQLPSPLSLSVGDVNSDGAADAVVTSSANAWFDIVTTVAGQPSHTSRVNVPASSSPSIYVAVGDLDGDGDDDVLALEDDFSDVMFTPFTQRSPGLFVAGPTSSHDTTAAGRTFSGIGPAFGPRGMQLFDWDGDGDLDLGSQITNLGSSGFRHAELWTMIFENTGGARFDPPITAPVDRPGRLAGTGDFDGDGVLDLCGAGAVIFGSGSFQPIITRMNPTAAAGGRAVDADGDGDVDYSLPGQRFRSTLENDGTGEFTFVSEPLPVVPSNHSYRGALLSADFDSDGRRDILAEFWDGLGGLFGPNMFLGMRVIRQRPDGTLVDPGVAATATGVILQTEGGALAADFDRDGDVDVFAPDGLWTNDGTGFFNHTTVVAFDSVVDVGDVEPDGDPDVLMRSATQLFLLRNNNGTSFTSIPVITEAGITAQPRLLDLDGDGDLDVLTPSLLTLSSTLRFPKLSLSERMANGGYAQPIVLDPVTTEANHFAMDDVDGDGRRDLLAVSSRIVREFSSIETFSFVNVYRSSGPGLQFDAPVRFFGPAAAALFDADADGDIDVVGRGVLRGQRFSTPAQGRIRQFGTGTAGAGGAIPRLGAQGPAIAGSPSYELRLRGAPGAAPTVLLVGTREQSLTNFPFQGMTLWVGGNTASIPLPIGGAANVPGAGALSLPIPIQPSSIGTTLFLQTWHLDATAPTLVIQSNGLEVTTGT